MDALHEARRAGPLVCVALAQFPTFSQVTRLAGIVNQTNGEKLASVL